MSKKKKSSLELNLEALNNYVKDKQFKNKELLKIINRLNALMFMINTDHKKKEEGIGYIGTEEWTKIANTIDAIKVRIAQLILNL